MNLYYDKGTLPVLFKGIFFFNLVLLAVKSWLDSTVRSLNLRSEVVGSNQLLCKQQGLGCLLYFLPQNSHQVGTRIELTLFLVKWITIADLFEVFILTLLPLFTVKIIICTCIVFCPFFAEISNIVLLQTAAAHSWACMDLYVFATPYRITWDYYFSAREHSLKFDSWEETAEMEYVYTNLFLCLILNILS